ncbi:MAG: HAMP domain-containing protein, partial [Solirubrobacteraceae bacterium]
MSLRRRLALIAAASVAIAVMIACLVCYLVVRDQLRGQIDSALRAQESVVQNYGQISRTLPGIPASAGGPAPYVDVVLANGQSGQYQGNVILPVSASTIQVAKGTGAPFFSDATVGQDHLRVLTFHVTFMVGSVPESAALLLARPLNGVDGVLSKLRVVLLLVFLGGIALAAALGRLAGRRVLAPLAEVAQAAEHISQTEDLTGRIRVHADDEVGALATRFNSMLDRLESSRAALDES